MKISDSFGRLNRVNVPSTPARPAVQIPSAPKPPVGFPAQSSFAPAPAQAPVGGDANASALLGLKRGATGTDGKIKQLQDDLMRMGFLDKSVVSNSGYGNTFGPRTEAAVKALQSAKGLPVTGQVDLATVSALGPQTPPAPIVPGTTYPGAPAGDPNAAAVAGLQKGTGTPAQVKQLQDDLIRMGYAPASFTQNGGYGNTFGPKTEDALKHFQQDNGLPTTGVVDAQTATALSGPRPLPAPVAAGVGFAYRDQLGLPAGPAVTQPDGSVRQNFDKGYVEASKDGMLYVRTPAGQDIVPPQKLGTASSVAEANQSFLSQWGKTDWNSAQGAPYGYEDCGPTSVAISLSALGLIPHPSPADAEKTIDAMRDAALGYDSTKSQGTGDGQLIRALEANGAQTATVKPLTVDAINTAIAAGHPLIVGSGSTWDAWGRAQCAKGDYLNGQNPGGHFVTVMGMAPNGNYIVNDPLSKNGAIEVTRAQIEKLISGAWDGIEVSRK